MTISTISVSDMHCSACASKIRSALEPLVGIRTAHINPVRRQVLIEHDSSTNPLDILQQIESAGFNPTLAHRDDHDARQRSLLKRLGVAGLAMMQVMMASISLYAGSFDGMDPVFQQLFQYTSLIFCIPVVSYSAMPFFVNALASLSSARSGLSMDVPIALAIAVAFLSSLTATLTGSGEVYYDSVVMFTFLLLGARYIDNRLQQRFELTGQLLAALPQMAIREIQGRRQTVAIAELDTGDSVWVDEGGQVPVDGLLKSSAAQLDEAVLTGEADWVAKQAGDRVYAGTLNTGPGFLLQASSGYERSRLADIAALADQAELERTDILRLADRIAAVFIPAVLSLSALTYLGWQFFDPDIAFVAALTVLVVSCPCALSLATPAALTAAMTRLRQLGIVLTDSIALERAATLDRVFIDKTGTLTIHTPHIERLEVLTPLFTEAECLAIAGALQQHSSHPYAGAFPTSNLPTDAIEVVPGLGIAGLVDGQQVKVGAASFINLPVEDRLDRSVYLEIDGTLSAKFELSDQIRGDARAAIESLRMEGIESTMLSGDSHDRCMEVASQLSIDFLARQTPESKLDAVKQARAEGHRVLMLGDGINDVPVLAAADVSAAVVEASDLVKSKADVLLLNRKLQPLVEFVRIARRTRTITRQNLLWALIYNLVAIPIAALGFMPPWLAALGMASSSTLVMLNATRLLRPS